MASKVEILGGQLDGSTLDNAASESTLKELVEAIKKLEATTKASAGKSSGGSSNKSTSPDIDTKDANAALDALSKGLGKGAAAATSGLGKLSGAALRAAGAVASSLSQMGALVSTGNNNLSQFVGALNVLPGPLGKFASAIATGINALEEMQETQRELSKTGASFNNSMMEMRITAARSGLNLAEFASVLKENAQSIGGLGDTITDGAKKLAEVGNAVGSSGLDESFMKLGMSATDARKAAMKFSTELVKGDRVRSASATELAGASLDYEKDLDLLAKQTGKTKDQLRAFSEGMIKGGGAMTFAFAKMSPQMQAAMKGIMDGVGATMGQGAQDAMADVFSGAAAPSSEASAMFQSQMPGVVSTFKEMRDTAALVANTDEERAAKSAKLDSLKATAASDQLKYLQSAQGQFMMQNKSKLAPAQRQFIEGLEAQAKSLSEQGIDINTASKADIERVIAAKRAEQEKQAALDKGFNAFQATITKISSTLQTTFFSILSPILEKLAGGLENLMKGAGTIVDGLADMGIAMETITPVIDFIVDMLGITLGTAFEMLAFVASKAWDGMMSLLAPIQELFAAFGILGTDTEGVTNGFKTLMDGINTTYIVIKDILGGAFDFLFQMLRTMIGVITDVVNLLKVTFAPQIEYVAGKLKSFADFVMEIGPEILKGLRAFFSVEGAKAFTSGVKTMLQSATGAVLSGISDIIPDWAGGKELAATAKSMTEAGKESRDEFTKQKEAALAQADARGAAVAKEIETKKAETAQATSNFKTNLDAGKAALAERRAREKAEAESAADRKNAAKDQLSTDAMARSQAAAIKGMRERAGIETAPPRVAPSPGYGPAAPGGKVPSGALGKMQGLQSELASKGITDPKAVANIMAQVQAESGGVAKSENLKYSGKTLFELYGAGNKGGNKVRFNSVEEASAVAAKGEEAVGNVIYGGRMGNKEDEGYKYRGRGLIQLTGKDNYKKFGDMIGVDLVKNPDMANDPAIAQKLAAAYFSEKQKKGVNLSDINAIGKAVGYAGGAAETAKRSQLADGFSAQLAGGSAPTTQTAAVKPTTPGATVPNGASAVAATAGMSEQDKLLAQNKSKLSLEQQALVDAKSIQPTQTATSPATNPITEVIASLNTSLAQLTMMQGKAVAIAEQQLRATQGLSRDAYKAV